MFVSAADYRAMIDLLDVCDYCHGDDCSDVFTIEDELSFADYA